MKKIARDVRAIEEIGTNLNYPLLIQQRGDC